jgi:hypothetical protein
MRALAALAFPRFSRVGDPRRLVPVCWETWCSCIRTCRARIRGNCRVGWTLVGQDGDWQGRGKLFFAFFHVRVIFFTEVVFAFRFVPSFLAVCGRSKIKKHVSVCPWSWEPVLASLLGILFQRQRPQQWLRNTRVSFASGQL